MSKLQKLFIAKRKKLIIGFILIVLSLSLFSAARPSIDKFLLPFGRTPPVLILRDLVVASYAHIKAGDNIPYEVVLTPDEMAWNKIDYSRYGLVNTLLTFNVNTNSVWVVEKMRTIVPFYEYEGIREFPRYPTDIYITPYYGNLSNPSESFHILGQAYVEGGVVLLNERFFLEEERRDLRQVYSTMVHELIHQQEGGFDREVFYTMGILRTLKHVEARTQAATIEVLAGMCHYRDKVACKSFWAQIENYARGSLLMRLRMYGHEDWYDVIANLLWRDSVDEMARDKSLRHWMLDPNLQGYYYAIINNYQKDPWEDFVIEGICGQDMDTGFFEETLLSTHANPKWQLKLMMFDDTISMLGKGLTNFICKLPHGPGVP